MNTIQYAKYSRDRSPAFQIRTTIFRDNGGKWVEKVPLSPMAAAHVQKLAYSCQKLKEQYEDTSLIICPCRIQDGAAVFDYIEGDILTNSLQKMMAEADEEGIARLCMELAALVRSAKGLRPFTKTQSFTEIFGDIALPEGLMATGYSNIDMITDNFILSGRSLTLLDYEWCFDFPIPIDYTVFRMLYVIFEKWNREDYVIQTLCPLLGIPENAVSAFRKMETAFRDYICRDAFRLEDAYDSIHGAVYPFAMLHEAQQRQEEKLQHYEQTLTVYEKEFEARRQYLSQHRVKAAIKALLGMLWQE